MTRWKSDCCFADVELGNVSNYYICKECNEACDIYEEPKQKKQREEDV
jgi:hypothetical protein|tara:strand:- start:484 stop:627 length:144 start_codon:yes stop_codon:yes gene_type:complete